MIEDKTNSHKDLNHKTNLIKKQDKLEIVYI